VLGLLVSDCTTTRYVRPSEEFAYRGRAQLIVSDADGDARAVEVEAVRAHGDTVLASDGDSLMDLRFRSADVRRLVVRNAKRGAWQGMGLGLAAGTAVGFVWGSILESEVPDEVCEGDPSGPSANCRKTGPKEIFLYGGTLLGSLGGMAAGGLAGAWLAAKTEFVFKDTLVAERTAPTLQGRSGGR
jgi:hypothetical protein